jgi:hypothetical protein
MSETTENLPTNSKEEIGPVIEERRSNFPLLYGNIIISALLCAIALYCFVVRYNLSFNKDFIIFGFYTAVFGLLNMAGIKLFPKLFLKKPRDEMRQRTDAEIHDVIDFFKTSIVTMLMGVIMILVIYSRSN